MAAVLEHFVFKTCDIPMEFVFEAQRVQIVEETIKKDTLRRSLGS